MRVPPRVRLHVGSVGYLPCSLAVVAALLPCSHGCPACLAGPLLSGHRCSPRYCCHCRGRPCSPSMLPRQAGLRLLLRLAAPPLLCFCWLRQAAVRRGSSLMPGRPGGGLTHPHGTQGPHPPTWHARAPPTHMARKGPAHPHGTQGPRPPHWHAEAGPQPHPHPPASQLGSSLLKRCCRFLAALTHHTPPGLTP